MPARETWDLHAWLIVSIFTIDIAKRSGHEAFGRYTSAVQYLLHKSLILVPIFIAQKMVKTSENEGSGVSSLRKKRLELGCWGSNLACPSFGVVSLATNSRHSSQSFASDVRRSRSSVATYTLLYKKMGIIRMYPNWSRFCRQIFTRFMSTSTSKEIRFTCLNETEWRRF